MNVEQNAALVDAIGYAFQGRWDMETLMNQSDPWTDAEVALETIAEQGFCLIKAAELEQLRARAEEQEQRLDSLARDRDLLRDRLQQLEVTP